MKNGHNLVTLGTQKVPIIKTKNSKVLFLSYAENSNPVKFRNAFNVKLKTVLFAPKIKGVTITPLYLKTIDDKDDLSFMLKNPSILNTNKTCMIDLNYLFYIDYFKKYKSMNKLNKNLIDKTNFIYDKVLNIEGFKQKGYEHIIFNYQLDITNFESQITKTDLKQMMLGVIQYLIHSKNYDFPFNQMIITLKKNDKFVSFLAYNGESFKIEMILKIINSFIKNDNHKLTDKNLKQIHKILDNEYDEDSVATIIQAVEDYYSVNPDAKITIDKPHLKNIIADKLNEDNIEIKDNNFDNIVKKLLTIKPPNINISSKDNEFNEVLNEDKILGNGINFREHTFKENFKNQIQLFGEYYKEKYNISITNIQIKDIEMNDLDNTPLKEITYKFKDNDTGKVFDLKVNMPDLFSDQIVDYNGVSRILLYQLYQMPIQSPKPFECVFKSNYASITAKSIVKNKIQGLFFYVLGKQISALSFIAINAVNNCIKNCDDCISIIMKAARIDKKEWEYSHDESILKSNKYSIQFGDQIIALTNKASNKTKQLFWGFKTDLRSFKLSGCKNISKDLEMVYSQNYVRKILQLDKNIIDPVTQLTLKYEKMSDKTIDIYHEVLDKAIIGETTNQIALKNRRIRSSESMAIAMSKKITVILNEYDKSKKLGKIYEPKIDKDVIMKEMSTGQLQSQFEMIQNNNPWGEISAKSKVTFSGYDGIKAENATSKVRGVDQTYYGNIDPIDTPDSSAVGVTRNLSVDATLKNTNGKFEIHNNDEANPFSIISNYGSAPLHNDGNRLQFVSAQLKSDVPLVNSELPLVMSSYSNVPAQLASNKFIKKSPVNGEIIDIQDGYIIIQDNKRKKHLVHYNKYELLTKKSASTNKPYVEIGDKVKEGDPVAGSAEFFNNNNITVGVNLYTLLKPHMVYNFEDGIIISEAVTNKMQSHHSIEKTINVQDDDVIISKIPIVGDEISKSEPMLILNKKTMFTESNQLMEFDDTFNDLNDENDTIDDKFDNFSAKKVYSKLSGEVFSLDIFAKDEETLKAHPKIYDIWKNQIETLKQKIESFKSMKVDVSPLENKLKKLMKPWKKVDNILLRYKIHGYKSMKTGDKLHNRHGKSLLPLNTVMY